MNLFLRLLAATPLFLVGLLVGLCSIVPITTGYRATTVENDTADLRALCQDVTLKPESMIIYPSESKLAHSGNSCSIFEPSGSYVGCLRRYLISQADGGTVHVSQMDTAVSGTECPNGNYAMRAFDPVAHKPDRHLPTDAEKRQLGYAVIGGIVSFMLLSPAVILVASYEREWKVPKL